MVHLENYTKWVIEIIVHKDIGLHSSRTLEFDSDFMINRSIKITQSFQNITTPTFMNIIQK